MTRGGKIEPDFFSTELAAKIGMGKDRTDRYARPAHAAPSREAAGENMRWFAVNAQAKREARAQRQLENQGYYVYLPRRQKTVRHGRKLVTVLAPFFPRYLFVSLDLTEHRWRSINSTFGVSSLVMAGERPCPVPCGVVEAMIAATDSNGLLSLSVDRLAEGSKVRLLAGPFAEQIGILDRLDDSGRVRVLLSVMGGSVPVQITSDLVAAL